MCVLNFPVRLVRSIFHTVVTYFFDSFYNYENYFWKHRARKKYLQNSVT